jgi:hypothetical protein
MDFSDWVDKADGGREALEELGAASAALYSLMNGRYHAQICAFNKYVEGTTTKGIRRVTRRLAQTGKIMDPLHKRVQLAQRRVDALRRTVYPGI